MFAQIRFIVAPEGQYADIWFHVEAENMVHAAHKAHHICEGYTLGCGLKALTLELTSVLPGSTERYAVNNISDMKAVAGRLLEYQSKYNQLNKETTSA